jgi:hypothetical protein
MFSGHLLPITLLVCSCSFYIAGCDSEPNEFKSRLGLTTPCAPATDYFQAIEEYFSKKLFSYHSSTDQRPGKEKYKEITELVLVAKTDSAYCLTQNYNEPELVSDQWKTLQFRLSQISGVTIVYELWGKSWQDSDIDLFQRGLEGVEIGPDFSQHPTLGCEKECNK